MAWEITLVSYMSGERKDVEDAVNELNELFGGKYFVFEKWIEDAVYRITGYIEKKKIDDTDILNDFIIVGNDDNEEY